VVTRRSSRRSQGAAGATDRDPRFARRAALEERLRRVNALVEVLDARAPRATHSDAFRSGRFQPLRRVVALTHADLADPDATRAWLRSFDGRAVAVDAVRGRGVGALLDRLSALRPDGEVRAMVVGLPNVGKSSLINRLAGRARAATGNRPGVTVGEQWIEARPGLRMLDEPGLLPFHPSAYASVLGCVPEGRVDPVEAVWTLWRHTQAHAGLARWLGEATLEAAHAPELPGSGMAPHAQGADGDGASEAEERRAFVRVLEAAARRLGAVASGGAPDPSLAARKVLALFRQGSLGRVTLEWPEGAAADEAPSEKGRGR